MLASFQACGTYPTSQTLVISWCSLLNRLSPLCFHTSAGIPSPPGALPSFRPAIALANSAKVGMSSRLVLVMRCPRLPDPFTYPSADPPVHPMVSPSIRSTHPPPPSRPIHPSVGPSARPSNGLPIYPSGPLSHRRLPAPSTYTDNPSACLWKSIAIFGYNVSEKFSFC